MRVQATKPRLMKGRVMLRELFCGCYHLFSWPIKLPDGTHYQVCLRCGQEYGYDWDRMRRTTALTSRVTETRLSNSSVPCAGPHGMHPRENAQTHITPQVEAGQVPLSSPSSPVFKPRGGLDSRVGSSWSWSCGYE